MDTIISWTYQIFVKPVLFHFDPERVHDGMTRLGKLLGSNRVTQYMTRSVLDFRDSRLEQTLHGLTFPNPVGLAAGFDKDAHLVEILPDVGFGFAELGSVTGQPCAGNQKPRLWRLPDLQALRVYYGLKNDGAEAVSARLASRTYRIPVGISAAKTNSPNTVDPEMAMADYAAVLTACRPVADYFTINISCPNAFGGQPFTDSKLLDCLLSVVDAQNLSQPVFIKLSPDLSEQELDEILSVASAHRIQGYICTNLTKKVSTELPGKGGVSGKIVAPFSDCQIAYVYRKTGGAATIIGCGGIFSAEDAYHKIRLGASLVQLITGMVYQGPQLIGQLNRGLVRLLERDGLSSISAAVGLDNK